MEIIVNGLKKTTELEVLTYKDIIILAEGNPDYVHTVSYSVSNIAAIIALGESITAKNNMIFNACITGNA